MNNYSNEYPLSNDVYLIFAIGAPRCGKSALLCRWYGGAVRNYPGEYPGSYYEGIRRGITVDKIPCIVEFLEFEFTEKPTEYELNALSKSHEVVLMYSIDSKDSFSYIDTHLIPMINKYKTKPYFSMLCGCKCESTNRIITYEEGKIKSNQLNIPFIEVSAHGFINEITILENLVRLGREMEERGEIKDIVHYKEQKRKCLIS